MKPERFMALLQAGKWFGGLTPQLQQALLGAALPRTLAKGERLFARGDPPSGIYAVVSGSIRIATTPANGKELLLTVIEAPMWFGEMAVIDRQPRTHDAVADDETTLVHVPQRALDALLAREPLWWRDLAVLVTARLRLTFHVVEDAAFPLAIRLARRLVLTAERYGEWETRSSRVVDLRQEQLATMLGVSRQTINQLLKDLESRGFVKLSYGRIEILDIDALRRVANEAV